MKLLLFEDDEKMPLPRMLKKYLGDSVEFAKGAENLRKALMKHKDDEVLCKNIRRTRWMG